MKFNNFSLHPVLGCRSSVHTMLGVVFQLPVQALHQITCRAQVHLHRVIQEDLIGLAHLGKVQSSKDRLHIHHHHLHPVLHTVEADHQP